MSESLPETSSKEDEDEDEDEENVDENSPEALSNFRSLTVTTLTSSSVTLQWMYDRPQSVEPSREIVFKLLKLESRNEWKAIAWTREMTCKIENLEQNVCYSLQLLVLIEEKDEFKIVDESDVFKVSELKIALIFYRWRRILSSLLRVFTVPQISAGNW